MQPETQKQKQNHGKITKNTKKQKQRAISTNYSSKAEEKSSKKHNFSSKFYSNIPKHQSIKQQEKQYIQYEQNGVVRKNQQDMKKETRTFQNQDPNRYKSFFKKRLASVRNFQYNKEELDLLTPKQRQKMLSQRKRKLLLQQKILDDFNPYKLIELKIKIVQFPSKEAGSKPTILFRIKQDIKSDNKNTFIFVTYVVRISCYQIPIEVKYIDKTNDKYYEKPWKSGSFGKVIQVNNLQNKKQKQIKIQDSCDKMLKISNSYLIFDDLQTHNNAIKQYAYLKLAYALQVGVQTQRIDSCDLIIYKNCICFRTKKWNKLSIQQSYNVNQIQRFKAIILRHVGILHMSKISHNDIKFDNIVEITKRGLLHYALIDYGLTTANYQDYHQETTLQSAMGTKHFCLEKMKQYFQKDGVFSINLYENDQHCVNVMITDINDGVKFETNKKQEQKKQQQNEFVNKLNFSNLIRGFNPQIQIQIMQYIFNKNKQMNQEQRNKSIHNFQNIKKRSKIIIGKNMQINNTYEVSCQLQKIMFINNYLDNNSQAENSLRSLLFLFTNPIIKANEYLNNKVNILFEKVFKNIKQVLLNKYLKSDSQEYLTLKSNFYYLYKTIFNKIILLKHRRLNDKQRQQIQQYLKNDKFSKTTIQNIIDHLSKTKKNKQIYLFIQIKELCLFCCRFGIQILLKKLLQMKQFTKRILQIIVQGILQLIRFYLYDIFYLKIYIQTAKSIFDNITTINHEDMKTYRIKSRLLLSNHIYNCVNKNYYDLNINETLKSSFHACYNNQNKMILYSALKFFYAKRKLSTNKYLRQHYFEHKQKSPQYIKIIKQQIMYNANVYKILYQRQYPYNQHNKCHNQLKEIFDLYFVVLLFFSTPQHAEQFIQENQSLEILNQNIIAQQQKWLNIKVKSQQLVLQDKSKQQRIHNVIVSSYYLINCMNIIIKKSLYFLLQLILTPLQSQIIYKKYKIVLAQCCKKIKNIFKVYEYLNLPLIQIKYIQQIAQHQTYKLRWNKDNNQIVNIEANTSILNKYKYKQHVEKVFGPLLSQCYEIIQQYSDDKKDNIQFKLLKCKQEYSNCLFDFFSTREVLKNFNKSPKFNDLQSWKSQQSLIKNQIKNTNKQSQVFLPKIKVKVKNQKKLTTIQKRRIKKQKQQQKQLLVRQESLERYENKISIAMLLEQNFKKLIIQQKQEEEQEQQQEQKQISQFDFQTSNNHNQNNQLQIEKNKKLQIIYNLQYKQKQDKKYIEKNVECLLLKHLTQATINYQKLFFEFINVLSKNKILNLSKCWVFFREVLFKKCLSKDPFTNKLQLLYIKIITYVFDKLIHRKKQKQLLKQIKQKFQQILNNKTNSTSNMIKDFIIFCSSLNLSFFYNRFRQFQETNYPKKAQKKSNFFQKHIDLAINHVIELLKYYQISNNYTSLINEIYEDLTNCKGKIQDTTTIEIRIKLCFGYSLNIYFQNKTKNIKKKYFFQNTGFESIINSNIKLHHIYLQSLFLVEKHNHHLFKLDQTKNKNTLNNTNQFRFETKQIIFERIKQWSNLSKQCNNINEQVMPLFNSFKLFFLVINVFSIKQMINQAFHLENRQSKIPKNIVEFVIIKCLFFLLKLNFFLYETTENIKRFKTEISQITLRLSEQIKQNPQQKSIDLVLYPLLFQCNRIIQDIHQSKSSKKYHGFLNQIRQNVQKVSNKDPNQEYLLVWCQQFIKNRNINESNQQSLNQKYSLEQK